MNRFTRVLLCLGCSSFLTSSASADFVGLFNTGVGPTGALATPGSLDTHYTLISGPNGPGTTSAVIGTSIPPVWTPNTPTSQWIGVGNSNLNTSQPGGVYDFQTSFTLTPGNTGIPIITGSVASDDFVTIAVNGVTEYTNYGGFRSFSPITLTGFNLGTNFIDFFVTNAVPNTPVGLQTVLFGTTVPEPASVVMLGLGGVIAAGFGLRRRRAVA